MQSGNPSTAGGCHRPVTPVTHVKSERGRMILFELRRAEASLERLPNGYGCSDHRVYIIERYRLRKKITFTARRISYLQDIQVAQVVEVWGAESAGYI